MFKLDTNLPELCDSRPKVLNVHESTSTENDDLGREVYGLLGMPIDALDRVTVLRKIINAIEVRRPFLLSTPNVNFLTTSQKDSDFRESLLHSDLCVADGMPIVWLSRFLAIPIKERVSGSDLFDAIRTHNSSSRAVRSFLFGGAAGVAEKVCGLLNSPTTGIRCVGWLSPGFGTVDEMSTSENIAKINNSDADLLAVFLSAKKAQAWLLCNHDRLHAPVRGQFGATINYQAGTVRRAPRIVQKLGFEWLWRVKEEPYLWRRYLNDGLTLINLLAFCVLPIAVIVRWHGSDTEKLILAVRERPGSLVISLIGHATKTSVAEAIICFRGALAAKQSVVIDLSGSKTIDPRFFGLLLMLRKRLKSLGLSLSFTGSSNRIARIFRLNGFAYLLDVPGNRLSGSELFRSVSVKHEQNSVR